MNRPRRSLSLLGPLALGLALPSFAIASDKTAPCERGDASLLDAQQRLWKIDKDLHAIPDDADPAPIVAAIKELQAGKCFALAQWAVQTLDPDSVLALRTWWDAGGFIFFDSFLSAAGHARAPDAPIPPSMRRTVSPLQHPSHPFAELLCPRSNLRCAPNTHGWRARAEFAFRTRLRLAYGTEEEDCLTRAHQVQDDRKWLTWYQCLVEAQPNTSLMPVGDLRAPTSGWLIIHYPIDFSSPCHQLAAYDLATGTALVARDCAGWMTRDGVRTRQQDHEIEILAGGVPVANVRELAWMIAISEHAVPLGRAESAFYPLPENIPARVPDISAHGGFRVGQACVTGCGEPPPQWAFVHRERWGTGQFGDECEPVWEHVRMLLEVLEGGLEMGCATARLPKHVDAAALVTMGVVDPDRPEDVRLRDAFVRAATDEVCRRRKPSRRAGAFGQQVPMSGRAFARGYSTEPAF